MGKTNLSKFKKALELILWIIILSGVIFINLSPALLNIGRIQLTAVFSLFLLVFVFNRTITLTRFSPTKKIVLKTFIFLLFLYFVIYLFSFKIYELWIFYLLPVLLALSLSLAIVLQPRALTLALVAISIFLLGDIYWGMHLSATTAGINLPVIFSKVFSLSLLSILGYYLYRREQMATEELNILSQNLQKLNEELKLKTEELLRANKRLQELSEVKSRFVATVSHELRTPLTAILNSLKLIEYETKDNKEINEYLSLIKKNVDRQAIMIDNLLDLSKIERGHIEGVRTQVSLNRIVGEVIDLLKEKARDKNIHLLFEAKEDLPLIWADQEQVRRIFINLLD
ncbi:MAG: HAMP domain-containing histidine kinase, partial [Candidatus Omnitrophica bacterium]|nr:HAMP domain-containing histidine kinase [Candidatus Omnitrophota bacterium]